MFTTRIFIFYSVKFVGTFTKLHVMKSIQMVCYLKRHSYRKAMQTKRVEYLYSHCSMHYQGKLLMVAYQVQDYKGVLTGFWHTINQLKQAVKIELIFLISEEDNLEEIEIALKSHFVENKLAFKVLYSDCSTAQSQELISEFEKQIYPEFTLEFDQSGMTGERKVRCEISSEFNAIFSVYTERLDLLSQQSKQDEFYLSFNDTNRDLQLVVE